MNNKGGRPKLTSLELENILLKLMPYLHRGLSVNSACIEAQIAHTSVFKYMKELPWFAERIEGYKNYISVIYSGIRMFQLQCIYQKLQIARSEGKAIQLNEAEIQFLDWIGLYDKAINDIRAEEVKYLQF